MMFERRFIILAVILLIMLLIGIWRYRSFKLFEDGSIKIGILFAQTGSMAASEKPIIDTILMAIDDINSQGGVLGEKIQPIIVDTQSNDELAAQEGEKLITQDGVSVIFGCWTTECRKRIKPIVEKHQNLLISPVSSRGLEESPHILYTGEAPNQQVIPAIKWSFDHLGKRFFIVGSNRASSRISNAISQFYINFFKGEVVGERYVSERNIESIIQEILQKQPTVIVNTIFGEDNKSFFEALRRAGIKPDKIPVMSFNITENEIQEIGVKNIAGNYAAWNYFQSIPTQRNQDFVQYFKKKYGESRTINAPMESAYVSVYLWYQAVKNADTTNSVDVINMIKQQSYYAPEGVVSVDPTTSHVWKISRIGQIQDNGQFKIVWSSETPIQPLKYPDFISKDQWESLIHDIYQHLESPSLRILHHKEKETHNSG